MAQPTQNLIWRMWDAWRDFWTFGVDKTPAADARAFVTGPGVVEPWDMAWGKDSSTFAPQAYGDYVATSSTVYVCTTRIADLLSPLPLKLYRQNAKGERTEISNGAAYELLQRVNPMWTRGRLLNMTSLSLGLWGKAFWFLERGASGKGVPQEIWWARPDRVRVVPDPVNYVKGFLYRPANSTQDIYFDRSEVIWFRYPNPIDEYEGLSPLAAARLDADYASAGKRANIGLFNNGMNMGGILSPKAGQQFTEEQAKALELALERRFRGADKFHRWGVMRYEAELKEMGLSARDAEFMNGLQFSREEVANVYKVPLDLIGGQRTYENFNAAMRAMYTFAVLPQADFLAEEISEQLLPMFGREADVAAFDASGVDVLQADANQAWTREREQIETGVLTINEWRAEQGLTALPWGDVWWGSSALRPIENADALAAPPALPDNSNATVQTQDQTNQTPAGDAPRALTQAHGRAASVVYGSPEHIALFERATARVTPWEKKLGAVVADVMRRQQDAVLAKLQPRAGGKEKDAADNPFDLARWIKELRQAVRPVLREIVREAGANALKDYAIDFAFDLLEPRVVQFLEQRAQRFAQRVNETTWKQLQDTLNAGIAKGESIPQLMERVNATMELRKGQSEEMIARTEVIGASNGGTLEAWRQSGVVTGKEWLATLDDRVRDTHSEAHGQRRAIDENFEVGAASGPAPGQMGLAEEDINCRCTMIAILD